MLAPSGRNVRVRGLQVFNSKRNRVCGGSRVAVNIPSIGVSEIGRGDALASPQFKAQSRLEVEFTPLPGALHLLRRRNAVRLHLGSAEILGTLTFEEPPTSSKPSRATMYLRHSTLAFAGEHFVVRRLSPKSLLGGGVIAGTKDVAATQTQTALTVQRVAGVLRESGSVPLSSEKISALANLRETIVLEALEELRNGGEVTIVSKPLAYLHTDVVLEILHRVTDALSAQQQATPWILGVTSLALARALRLEESFLIRVLSVLRDDGKLAYRRGYYATLSHVPSLTAEQRAFFEKEVEADPSAPFLPASLPQVLSKIKASRITGLSQAFDTLVGSGIVVKISDVLYTGRQLAQIRIQLESLIQKEGEMTMAMFRDLIGTSRKYAVPLLEWFDASGVTVRSGDVRRLRARMLAQPQTGLRGF